MLRLLGLIKERGDIRFVQLMNEETGEVRGYEMCKVLKNLTKRHSSNTDIVNGQLVCTDGSINSLPYFDEKSMNVQNENVAVIGIIGNKYMITDYTGEMNLLYKNEAIELIKRTGSYNAKIVNRLGEYNISAIKGSFRQFNYDYSTGLMKEVKVRN